jgi:spermidine/putrescine transport system substrate-binding protein
MTGRNIDRLWVANRMTRRDAFKVGGGFAVAAGLSACGVGNGAGTSSESATEVKIEPKIDGDLVYFNYAQYINPSLVKQFEQKHGIQVRESYYDSMPAMMAKLGSGNHYDLVFPSAEFADKLIKGNQLMQIPRDKIHAAADIYPYYDDPWYDPGSAHTLPYSLYLTGLGYRADKIDTMTGSWRDIINPQADGRSIVLDDFQEGIGMANLVNGYDLNADEQDQLDEAQDYLVGLKPHLRGFSTDTITNMSSGNAWIQHLWNGDVINIRYRVDDPDTIQFQKNEEGWPVGSDVFAIPTDAEHPGTALMFIDFILENSAKNAGWTGYPMPTHSSAKPYAELTRNEPELQVTIEDLEKGQQFANLEGADREAWDRTWTEVKAA